MARPNREYPVPQLYPLDGRFKLRWYAAKKPYQISLGNMSKAEAQVICTASAAAFAGRADFPDEICDEPALKRYLLTRDNISAQNNDEALIRLYYEHMKAKGGSLWANTARCYLKSALAFIGTLHNAKSFNLHTYLDHLADTRSNATRNRYRAALSGFYRWLRATGQLPRHINPMADIQKLREERPPDGIIIWEEDEIKPLLKAADKREDGIAVWIATLAGLRRGEIARLQWPDITPAYIMITKSKTGIKRQIPLSKVLASRLEKEGKREGRVVPWPEKLTGWTAASGRLMTTYIPRHLPEIYKAHPEKFGWNALRHTFASRHAQRGLSLNVISAWLGDSPEVCKEHYARYVPKNRRDERIDDADPVL